MLVTIGGIALIDVTAAVLVLGGFVASGAPMIAGSIARHVEARRKEREYVRQTAPLAERGKRSER